jgi:hypothetical protein
MPDMTRSNAVGNVIPDEQPVPADLLDPPGQVGDHPGAGEVAEVGDVDGEAHGLAVVDGLDVVAVRIA